MSFIKIDADISNEISKQNQVALWMCSIVQSPQGIYCGH